MPPFAEGERGKTEVERKKALKLLLSPVNDTGANRRDKGE